MKLALLGLAGGAHPPRSGPAPYPELRAESPQPGHPHAVLCLRRLCQRTVRTVQARLAAERRGRPDHRFRQRWPHTRYSGARFRVEADQWPRTAKTGGKDPVFPSRKAKDGGRLRSVAVLRIVRRAAGRAGIELPVSPHWFRRAHTSHALDRGAPIHLVQATLGAASITPRGAICMPGQTTAPAVFFRCEPSEVEIPFSSLRF